MRAPDELRTLLRLSGPLILGYAGSQLMSMTDTAMVGRLGAGALAGVGIGNGVYFTVSVFGLGCVAGMEAPVAQAFGAGEPMRARRLLWQGMRVACGVSLPLVVIMSFLPSILPWCGIDAATTAEVRAYLWTRMLNVLPYLVFIGQRAYLQAAGVTRPIVVATAVGIAANALGNWLLIYRVGWGVAGAGLASTLAATAMCAMMGPAIARIDAPPDAQRRRFDRGLVRTILRLGVPNGLQVVAEVGVFATVGVLAGRIGATSAAAHLVAITLASFTFCVTLGIGAATSVRVGVHVGAGDFRSARHAGLVGLGASSVFMTASALAFFAFAPELAEALTNDPSVLAVAIPLVHVAAIFQLSDGLQATAAGALRGAGDPHAPLYANLVGHWVLGLPVAVALGFYAHQGAVGLWWGLSLGLTAVAIGLIARFLWLSSRPIRRV